MSSKPTKVLKAFQFVRDAFTKNPALFLPFFVFFCIEVISILVLFLAPRQPLLSVLGPPIRTFWGEQFLHYPMNFFLLPKLSGLSRTALAVIFGSFLSAMAVAMVSCIYAKKEVKLGEVSKTALKRYFSVLVIVYVFSMLYYISSRMLAKGLVAYFAAGHAKLLFFGPRAWLSVAMVAINFFLALVIQSAFVYALPVLIIDKVSLLKAMARAVVLFKKLFIPTLFLVGLPMLGYIPFIILYSKIGTLVDKFFPEVILLFVFLSAVINSLVIDPVITVSTTALFLANKEKS